MFALCLALWVNRYVGWLLWIGRCGLVAVSDGHFICGVAGYDILLYISKPTLTVGELLLTFSKRRFYTHLGLAYPRMVSVQPNEAGRHMTRQVFISLLRFLKATEIGGREAKK